ncbi:hypothetical protein MMPV_003694 [Pyropia vietnamensis]
MGGRPRSRRRWAMDLGGAVYPLPARPPNSAAAALLAAHAVPPGYVPPEEAAVMAADLLPPLASADEGGGSSAGGPGGGGRDGGGSSSSGRDPAVIATARRERVRLLYASAWRAAMAHVQPLLSTAVMLWASGNRLGVFSVLSALTGMGVHLAALRRVRDPFVALATTDPDVAPHLRAPRAVAVALVLAGVGLSVAKGATLGFLPTAEGDWGGLLRPRVQLEAVGGGLVL